MTTDHHREKDEDLKNNQFMMLIMINMYNDDVDADADDGSVDSGTQCC